MALDSTVVTDDLDTLPLMSLVVYMPNQALSLHRGFRVLGSASLPERQEVVFLSQDSDAIDGARFVFSADALISKTGNDNLNLQNRLNWDRLVEDFINTDNVTPQLGFLVVADPESSGWTDLNADPTRYTIPSGDLVLAGTGRVKWVYDSHPNPVRLYRDEQLVMNVKTATSTVVGFEAGLMLEQAGATDGLNARLTATAIEIRDDTTVRSTAAFTPATNTSYWLQVQRFYDFATNSHVVLAQVYNSAFVLIQTTSYNLSAPEIVTYNATSVWGYFVNGAVNTTVRTITWVPIMYPTGPLPLVELGAAPVADAGDKLWFKRLLTTFIAVTPPSTGGLAYAGLYAATGVEDVEPADADTEVLRGTSESGLGLWPKDTDWNDTSNVPVETTKRIRYSHRGRDFSLQLYQRHPFNKDTRINRWTVQYKPLRPGRA